MEEKKENTYWVRIYASGPIEEAKQIIRRDCLREGLCVTIEPTTYIYTGGEETGYVVGLINYPRFPASSGEIWARAIHLAELLREGTYQLSVLIMSPNATLWLNDKNVR